jgi:hypothetical protein
MGGMIIKLSNGRLMREYEKGKHICGACDPSILETLKFDELQRQGRIL